MSHTAECYLYSLIVYTSCNKKLHPLHLLSRYGHWSWLMRTATGQSLWPQLSDILRWSALVSVTGGKGNMTDI